MKRLALLITKPSDIFIFTGRTYGEILNNTVFPDFGAASGVFAALPAPVRNLLQLQDNGSILNMQADDSVLDTKADRKRHANGDFSYNDTQNVTLNMDWYKDGHTFSSITAYMAYQYDEECDCDFTTMTAGPHDASVLRTRSVTPQSAPVTIPSNCTVQ